MNLSFSDNIRCHFSYLFSDFGFEVVDLSNNYGGNIYVSRSNGLSVRFIRDRADFSLELARTSEPETWVEFYKLLDRLKADHLIHTNYKYSNKIEYVSNLFEQHFGLVESFMLTPDATL